MSFRAIAQYELPQCITVTEPSVPNNFVLIHSGNLQCSTALEISNLSVPIEVRCSGCISCHCTVHWPWDQALSGA